MDQKPTAADYGAARWANVPRRAPFVEGDIAFIPLTRGKIAVIDATDLPLVEGKNWSAHRRRNTWYAARNEKRADGKWRLLLLHRHLMGASDGQQVDHKNGDGLDCRRSENLRMATPTLNAANTKTRSDNTSGIKGVHLRRDTGRWSARIRAHGVVHFLGCFDSAAEAQAAYAAACRRIHGEFGRWQ